MKRDLRPFQSNPIQRRSSSGKMLPYFFLNISPEELEEFLGDHVVVLSSDGTSLASALGYGKPVCIEDLDLTPPELVGDVVRLITSLPTVVATASDSLRASVESSWPDFVMDDAVGAVMDAIDQRTSAMILSLDPALVPLMVQVFFLSDSGAHYISVFGLGHPGEDGKDAVLRSWQAMCPKRPHSFRDVMHQCTVDLKTFYGPEESLGPYMAELTRRVEAARVSDVETDSTPFEVAKRAAIDEFRTWFLDEMGLADGSLPDLQKPGPGQFELTSVFVAVSKYFQHIRKQKESIPSHGPAMEEVKPLIAAYRAAVSAGQSDGHSP